jgi:DNA-binding GntR family transcriptional regulator
MTSFIEPLSRESTPSIIADKLRRAIAHGELKPGAQLGEAELARKLGVSRGPLREGMQRLTQEGLLVAIRNRGLFVVEMTPDDVRDMYVAREAIERAAARKILDGDHAAAGDELLLIVDQMAATGTPAEVSELDIAFHERLLQLARSPRLSRMHQTFITETRMCIHALDETYAKSEVRDHEHRALANAIRSGDRDLTDRLLTAHMDDAIHRLNHDRTAIDGAEPADR